MTFVGNGSDSPCTQEIYLNLVVEAHVDENAPNSIHLRLSRSESGTHRCHAGNGSSARARRRIHGTSLGSVKLKTRQPLRSLTVVHHNVKNVPLNAMKS